MGHSMVNSGAGEWGTCNSCKAILEENTTLGSSPWRAILPLSHGLDYMWPNCFPLKTGDVIYSQQFSFLTIAGFHSQASLRNKKGKEESSCTLYTSAVWATKSVPRPHGKIWTALDRATESWLNVPSPCSHVLREPKVNSQVDSCRKATFRKITRLFVCMLGSCTWYISSSWYKSAFKGSVLEGTVDQVWGNLWVLFLCWLALELNLFQPHFLHQ